MTTYTSLSEEEQQEISDSILIKEYKKGSLLVRQGDVSSKCYFVLKGCVRQYSIDESGREITSNFYTEEQAIATFNHHKQDQSSKYDFVCTEDCILVVGDLDTEKRMYKKYNQLEAMTRKMMEISFSEVQDEFASFINSTPEERYKALMMKRPHLLDRVPQHQLASYLGITPESFSRIKKRMQRNRT
nr:Crp/Fnr family transcriptional regulator [Oceanobacillus saliphilus]